MPSLSQAFSQAASAVSRWTGRPLVFLGCCAIVVAWAGSGPVFHYSDTWQLVINTGTTIITFLMVFLIQNTQNRDNAALQAKLDELIRAHTPAKNEFIGIEHLSDDELEEILAECERNRPDVIDRAEKRVAGERKTAAARERSSQQRRKTKTTTRKKVRAGRA
jgi:low affinity Fe/Cu permease